MKVTLIGHASLLVEAEGLCALMDPVLEDPFEEGAVVSCPAREVNLENLLAKELTTVIISHRHLDHFDIASLAKLPRHVDVLCPQDHVIGYALEQLGFKNVHPTPSMQRISFPKHELLTTKSSVTNVTEFGIVFRDASGTFWNQVDTFLSPATIQGTLQAVGNIDLLFAMYASQNFNFFDDRNAPFPVEWHQRNLNSALSIKPRMVVPGSGGFRFAEPHEWFNPFLFPISREQFVEDMRRLAPEIDTRIANPGDVFEIEAGTVVHRPGASDVVRMVDDDSHKLRFDPTAPIPPLTDPNPTEYSLEHLRRAVADVVEGLTRYLGESYARDEKLVSEYRSLRARYTLVVVFPDGMAERWRISFGPERFQLQTGSAAQGPTDVTFSIAASALVGYVEREKSYFYVRAYMRRFSTLYAARRTEEEGVLVEARDPDDLFWHFLQTGARGAEVALKDRLDRQLAPFLPR